MTLIEKLRRQIEILEKNEQRLSYGSLTKSTTVHQDGRSSASKPDAGPSPDSLSSRLERLREFQPKKTCQSNGFELQESRSYWMRQHREEMAISPPSEGGAGGCSVLDVALETRRTPSDAPLDRGDFERETDLDLGGEIRHTAAGSFLYFSNQFEGQSEERNESCGSNGELVLSLLQLLTGSKIECEPCQIAFLDTETTGLSGGSGTYAFLVGIGSWNASGFCVEQFFMRDFHEETALLLALQERLTDVRLLVTFNGKSFDLPLLDSRYVLTRLDRPLGQVTHLDLLYPARRLWKLRLRDCSLMNLEKWLLGLWRENDVPGNLIPHLYFNYTRTGVATGLRAILQHNRQDIQSLAALTLLVGRILLDYNAKEDLEPEELLSAAKYFQVLGEPNLSLEFNQAALQRNLPPALRIEAMQRSASLFKYQKIYSQAVALWEAMISDSQEFQDEACENLAIYFEHRAKDVAKALEVTEYAVDRIRREGDNSESFSTANLGRWLHRRDRLRRKRNKSFAIR